MISRQAADPIVVWAPATSANLGSGFDTAGIALDWWDTLTVTPSEGSSGDFAAKINGEESQAIPAGRDNILIEAMMRFAQEADRKLPALSVDRDDGFPLSPRCAPSATGITV